MTRKELLAWRKLFAEKRSHHLWLVGFSCQNTDIKVDELIRKLPTPAVVYAQGNEVSVAYVAASREQAIEVSSRCSVFLRKAGGRRSYPPYALKRVLKSDQVVDTPLGHLTLPLFD